MRQFQQKLDLISVLPSSNFSAVKCTNVNCSNGYLLPKNSLDYNSVWTCKSLEPKVTDGCDIEMSIEDINKVKIKTLNGETFSLEEIAIYQFKRGKVKIDRRLDLHGYGLIEAQHIFKSEVKKKQLFF